MPSTEQHIEMRLGEDRTLDISLDGIDATTATEIEYGAWAGSSVLFTTKALTSGVTATDADTVTVTLDAADTASGEAGIYQHELRITNASSKQSVVMTGTLTLVHSLV